MDLAGLLMLSEERGERGEHLGVAGLPWRRGVGRRDEPGLEAGQVERLLVGKRRSLEWCVPEEGLQVVLADPPVVDRRAMLLKPGSLPRAASAAVRIAAFGSTANTVAPLPSRSRVRMPVPEPTSATMV